MLVRDRMKRDPVTVKKEDRFRYPLKLIRKAGIRHLPVLLIRAPAAVAADLRRRLATAGHPPLDG
ncbi:MAG: hypothetical protein ACREKF_08245 [Candidatus Methylomirabilales bacterium]